jgi:hypothetical protein
MLYRFSFQSNNKIAEPRKTIDDQRVFSVQSHDWDGKAVAMLISFPLPQEP